jgi:prepilin-type N-terminal cleavage/methylation domain-containing protein
MEKSAGKSSQGFTLVEILIVIVIVGVLATVVVYAVAGVTDKGQTSACAAEHETIIGAEEARSAELGTYGTMAELVSTGRLRSQSILFTVAVNGAGNAYTLAGIGACVGYVPG